MMSSGIVGYNSKLAMESHFSVRLMGAGEIDISLLFSSRRIKESGKVQLSFLWLLLGRGIRQGACDTSERDKIH